MSGVSAQLTLVFSFLQQGQNYGFVTETKQGIVTGREQLPDGFGGYRLEGFNSRTRCFYFADGIFPTIELDFVFSPIEKGAHRPIESMDAPRVIASLFQIKKVCSKYGWGNLGDLANHLCLAVFGEVFQFEPVEPDGPFRQSLGPAVNEESFQPGLQVRIGVIICYSPLVLSLYCVHDVSFRTRHMQSYSKDSGSQYPWVGVHQLAR